MKKNLFLVPFMMIGVSLVACNKDEPTTFKVKCDYDDVELTSYQASKGKTYNTTIELKSSAIERAATLPDEPVVTISNNPFTNYSYNLNVEKTKADFTIEGKYVTGDIKIELSIYYPTEYTITWDLGDGTTYDEKYYEGEMPTYPYGPVVREDSQIIDNYYQTSYVFTEWLDDDGQKIHRVNDNTTYHAQYKEKSAVNRFILSGLSVAGKFVTFNYVGEGAIKINWGDGNILDTELSSGTASHFYNSDITDEYLAISVFGKVTSIAFSGRNSSSLVETFAEGNTAILCASLSAHIETIKEDSFADLTALNTFFIPSNVIHVEKNIAIYCDRSGSELNFYIENSEIVSTWDATWNAVVPSSKPQLYPVYNNVHTLGIDDEGFTYVSILYNGYEELAITGYYGSTLGALTIPEKEKVNETYRPVTAIIFAPFKGSYITSLTLPDSIDCIGKDSFKNCSYLTTISISNATNEGQVWPKYLEKIDTDAFRGCSSLSIDLDFTNNDYLTSIGSGAFYGSAVTSLKLGDNIKSVGNLAFCSCSKLASVDLENATNLTTISSGMFQNARITSLKLHDSIADIGDNAFSSGIGTSLGEKLVLPSKLKSIGSQAFYNMPTTIALDASAYQVEDDIPSSLPNILNNGGSGFTIYIHNDGLKDSFLKRSWPSRANYVTQPVL